MPHNSKILTYIALKLYTYSKGLTRLAKRRNALGCFSLHWTEILYCMKTRSLPAQTANCPLLPNHGLYWLHWDDPNLRSTVFMKTVFMLNALFFLQHKRYSVLKFFFLVFFSNLKEKNPLHFVTWKSLRISRSHVAFIGTHFKQCE